jgi:hypothetical protein
VRSCSNASLNCVDVGDELTRRPMSDTCRFPVARAQRFLAAVVVCLPTVRTIAGCTSQPGPIIGDVHEGIANDASEVVDNATQDLNASLLVETAGVQEATNNTMSALGDVLHKGLKQVDASVDNAAGQLEAVQTDLRCSSLGLIGVAVGEAQQFSNRLRRSATARRVGSASQLRNSATPCLRPSSLAWDRWPRCPCNSLPHTRVGRCSSPSRRGSLGC